MLSGKHLAHFSCWRNAAISPHTNVMPDADCRHSDHEFTQLAKSLRQPKEDPKVVTDKVRVHSYQLMYGTVLWPLRFLPLTLLKIGLGGCSKNYEASGLIGASAKMWPHALRIKKNGSPTMRRSAHAAMRGALAAMCACYTATRRIQTCCRAGPRKPPPSI